MFDFSIKDRFDVRRAVRKELLKITADDELLNAGEEIMTQRLEKLCMKHNMSLSEFFFSNEAERVGIRHLGRVSSFSDYMDTLELIRVLHGMSKYEFAILPDRDRSYYKNLIRKQRNEKEKTKCFVFTIIQFVLPLGITPAMFFRFHEVIISMDIDIPEVVRLLDDSR